MRDLASFVQIGRQVRPAQVEVAIPEAIFFIRLSTRVGGRGVSVRVAPSSAIESQGGYLRTRFLVSDGAKGRSLSAGLRRVKEVTETSMSPPCC